MKQCLQMMLLLLSLLPLRLLLGVAAADIELRRMLMRLQQLRLAAIAG